MSRIIPTAVLSLIVFVSASARSESIILPLPPDDREAIAKRLGAKVVGEALPCVPIENPSALFPFHPERQTYRFTSGKNSGKTQVEALTKVERPGGQFAWRLQLAPTLSGFLKHTPEGDIDMPAVEDSSEGAVVVLTPGNPFLPKDLKPGETRTYTQKVSVRFVDDLSDERYAGTLKSDYTYVGTFRVNVPAGPFEAILLRTKVDGKVGPAHTHGTSYNFFAPNVGLVAMILQQKVSAFWIYNIDSAGGKVLVSRPTSTGAFASRH